jgi:hypothetical protein
MTMSADTARSSLLADYLSEEELGTELKKHKRTLKRWRDRGIGPPYVMNGVTPLYHRPGTAQWLAAGGTAGVKRNRGFRSRGR